MDDLDADGPQQVTLTASASGYVSGSSLLTVTDNEPSVEGVTPAAANNSANGIFVTALRNGSLNSPALFRIGIGAVIPTGLTLDANSGALGGTISTANAAGDYLIVIERYNTLGESVSQSFTLTLGGAPTYASWIGGFSVGALDGPRDDPDQDGLPNAIENFLGTAPDTASAGLTQISATAATLVFRHTRTNAPATDLTASYEWSGDLVAWQPSGGGVVIEAVAIINTTAPANDLIEVTATVTGAGNPKIFVRLKSVNP